MSVAWFTKSDGSRHTATVGSVAYDLMSKDGAFVLTEIDGERQAVSAIEPDPKAILKPDYSGKTKKELLEIAADRGVEVNAKLKLTDVIAVLEAADAEAENNHGDI